jgi:hypothetical protein
MAEANEVPDTTSKIRRKAPQPRSMGARERTMAESTQECVPPLMALVEHPPVSAATPKVKGD